MLVRAKLLVTAVTHFVDPAGAREVVMRPVHEDGGVNAKWSRWTPSGEVRLSITNPDAAAQFEVGQHWFADFTPTTKEG